MNRSICVKAMPLARLIGTGRSPTFDIEQLLSSIATDDGVFAVNADQKILFWSESACRLLGYSAQEVVGKPCHEVIGGRDPGNFRFCRRNCPTIANGRRGRTTPNFDICKDIRNRGKVWLNVSILLLNGRKKRPSTIVHVFRDVTRRRELERTAAEALNNLRRLVTESEIATPLDPEAGIAPTPLPMLTKRELEVLRLLALGLSTGEIAQSLVISPVTARNHIARMLNKIGAKSRVQALAFASSRGLI